MPSVDAYQFTDAEFDYIRKLATGLTGISIGESKRAMIYGRLSRRLRRLGIGGFQEYCELLKNDEGELNEFVNAITTNVTHFFRENHHFEYMKRKVLPECIALHRQTHKLRVWSAGCSKGHEPYSLAMVLDETLPKGQTWDAKILATDIDSNVLAHGRAGEYEKGDVAEINPDRRTRYVETSPRDPSLFRMKPEIRSYISFKRLNLMGEWPMKGHFDVIFCRNVVIYFDKPTQSRLFARFWERLRPGGYLFLGHSESLLGTEARFELVDRSVYQRIDGGGTGRAG